MPSTVAGDLPPELQPVAPAGRQRRPMAPHRRPAGSRSASAPRQTGPSSSRHCGLRAISTGRSPSRSGRPARRRRRGVVSPGRAAGDAAPRRCCVFDVSPARAIGSATLASSSPTIRTSFAAPPLKDLGLVAGEPALTQSVLDAEQKLLGRRPQGRLRAGQTRRARRRRRSRDASDGRDAAARPGPAGRVRRRSSFTGGEGVDPEFLRGRVPFAAGERYDPTWSTEARIDLFDTNLFSTIVSEPADDADRAAAGSTSPTTCASARRARSAPSSTTRPTSARADGCSGSIATSSARASGSAPRSPRSEPQQSLTASLLKPDLLRPRQNLIVDATASRQRLEAYDSEFDRWRRERRAGDSASGSRLARHRPALRPDQGPQGARGDVHPAVVSRQARLGLRRRPLQPDPRGDPAGDR